MLCPKITETWQLGLYWSKSFRFTQNFTTTMNNVTFIANICANKYKTMMQNCTQLLSKNSWFHFSIFIVNQQPWLKPGRLSNRGKMHDWDTENYWHSWQHFQQSLISETERQWRPWLKACLRTTFWTQTLMPGCCHHSVVIWCAH